MKKNIIKNILLGLFVTIMGVGTICIYSSVSNNEKKELPPKIEALSAKVQSELLHDNLTDIVASKESLKKLQYSQSSNSEQKDELYKIQEIIELTSNIVKYQEEFDIIKTSVNNATTSQANENIAKKLSNLENSKLAKTITKQLAKETDFDINTLREKFHITTNAIRELTVNISSQS